MKNLVVGKNGTWLASHLNCTLYNNHVNGSGLVTKVDDIQDVWDNIIVLDDTVLEENKAVVFGTSPIGRRLKTDETYKTALLAGEQFKPCPNEAIGHQVGIMQWWDGEGFVGKPVLVIEQLGFMNRDLGLQLKTPQGVTLFPISRDSKLVSNTLSKVVPLLDNYQGPVCFQVTVSGKHIYVNDLILGFPGGWVECVLEIQKGHLLDQPFNVFDDMVVGIMVSVPPYPYSDVGSQPTELSLSAGALKHTRFYNCYQEKDVLYGSQELFLATAWGPRESSAQDVRMRVMKSLRYMDIPKKQYRTDISTCCSFIWPDLVELGLI